MGRIDQELQLGGKMKERMGGVCKAERGLQVLL